MLFDRKNIWSGTEVIENTYLNESGADVIQLFGIVFEILRQCVMEQQHCRNSLLCPSIYRYINSRLLHRWRFLSNRITCHREKEIVHSHIYRAQSS